MIFEILLFVIFFKSTWKNTVIVLLSNVIFIFFLFFVGFTEKPSLSASYNIKDTKLTNLYN